MASILLSVPLTEENKDLHFYAGSNPSIYSWITEKEDFVPSPWFLCGAVSSSVCSGEEYVFYLPLNSRKHIPEVKEKGKFSSLNKQGLFEFFCRMVTVVESKYLEKIKERFENTVPTLKIKLDKGAILPTKAHPTDSGWDLTIIKKEKVLRGGIIMYDTGVSVSPSPGFYTKVFARSSLSKTGWKIANDVGIIDHSYRGTIKIVLVRTLPGVEELTLPFKGFQMIVEKLHPPRLEVVEDLEGTERGEGGFGSTSSKETKEPTEKVFDRPADLVFKGKDGEVVVQSITDIGKMIKSHTGGYVFDIDSKDKSYTKSYSVPEIEGLAKDLITADDDLSALRKRAERGETLSEEEAVALYPSIMISKPIDLESLKKMKETDL